MKLTEVCLTPLKSILLKTGQIVPYMDIFNLQKKLCFENIMILYTSKYIAKNIPTFILLKGDNVKSIKQFTQGTYLGPCNIN